MEKFSVKNLLLGVVLSAITLSAAEVTGKWSGTLQHEGQTDSRPAFMILKQDGNKLAGSAGPTESEQHPFEGGKVEGNKLTFDVAVGGGVMHFEMKAQGDQITGNVRGEREGKTMTGTISLTRAAEK